MVLHERGGAIAETVIAENANLEYSILIMSDKHKSLTNTYE